VSLLVDLSTLAQMLLVAIKYTGWEALEDPVVIETLVWGHTLQGIPFEASADEIDELTVGFFSQLFHDVLESFLFFMVRDYLKGRWHRCIVVLELAEEFLACRSRQNRGVRHPNDINYQLHLLTLICAREQWESSEQLDHDAAEAPHVDLLSVGE